MRALGLPDDRAGLAPGRADDLPVDEADLERAGFLGGDGVWECLRLGNTAKVGFELIEIV